MTAHSRRAVLTAAASTLGLSAASVRAQPATEATSWRIATVTPNGFPMVYDAVADFAQSASAMSAGRLRFELIEPAANGGAAGLLKLVSEGKFDAAHATAHYYAEDIPAIDYFTAVPFGLTAIENHGWMTQGGGMTLFERILASRGVVPMIGGNTSVQMGGWFAKEIKTAGDFRGVRIRLNGLPARVLQALGASTVEVGFGQIGAAFQSGKIDAADIIGPWVDQPLGIGRFAPFYYAPWHEPDVCMHLFFNKKRFDALSDDLKAIMRNAADAVSLRSIARAQYRNAVAMKALEQSGTQVRRFPTDVIRTLKRVTAGLLESDRKRDADSRAVIDSFWSYIGVIDAYARLTDALVIEQR
jgi:TRAP-type mannitol/chloroaromatic compound transport system substrate-binding protein